MPTRALRGVTYVTTMASRNGGLRYVRVRRARVEDWEDVVAINDNVYDGLDYLPVAYNSWMENKQHMTYLAETDEHVVIKG